MENYICEIVATYKKKRGFKPFKASGTDQMIKFIRSVLPKNSINHFESFGVVFLDNALNVNGYKILSQGGISGTVVDIKMLFQSCIICNCSQIVIFHNHPTGNLQSSIADKEVTNKIKKGAKTLEIKVLDHFIVTEKGFTTV